MAISKETLSLISTFKNPIIEKLSEWKDEIKFYFDTGIVKYVENIKNKYSKTKTFLFRNENVDFYDVYFPITLKNQKSTSYEIKHVEELFDESNFICIIGNAGCGKSMLLKHIFLLAIKQVTRIPIVIELRNLNEFKGSFFEYVNKSLSGKKIAPNDIILERILSSGDFIFLLDGYDEVFSSSKNKLTTELIDFIDTYSNNYFLVTSRPGANVESLPRFDNYFVNQLNLKQIKQFINLQLKKVDDIKLGKKIIEVVERPENQDYNSYLSSPLLLSMFIMTFNSYPELPKTKSKFYWNVFDTLCTKHDSFTKYGGYQHERKTGLQNEELENILKWFAYTSLFKGRYDFDDQYLSELLSKIKVKLNLDCDLSHLIEDLTVATSIIIIDGLEYRFPHKSLQEYFTALLIKEQSDPIKKEIYSKKIGQLIKHTFGGNENFWNLCQEMDVLAFTKYFQLAHIDSFISIIDMTSEELMCKSFMKWGNFSQGIIKDKQTGELKFNGISWDSNITMQILEEMKVLHVTSFAKIDNDYEKFILKLKVQGVIKENAQNNLFPYSLDYSNNWNDLVYNAVIELGHKDKILNIITKMKKLQTELNDKITFIEKSNSELLEL